MPAKQAFPKAKSDNVFGQARKPAKMFRAGLYARVSTNDQQTLPMQNRAMREYAARRGWTIAVNVREVGSGAAKRKLVRNCWRPHAVARSMWCWCGGWTAGAGR
jgi:predicted site-specific integrase-resolvase